MPGPAVPHFARTRCNLITCLCILQLCTCSRCHASCCNPCLEGLVDQETWCCRLQPAPWAQAACTVSAQLSRGELAGQRDDVSISLGHLDLAPTAAAVRFTGSWAVSFKRELGEVVEAVAQSGSHLGTLPSTVDHAGPRRCQAVPKCWNIQMLVQI